MPITAQDFGTLARIHRGNVVPFDQARLRRHAYMWRGACRAISTVWLRSQRLIARNAPVPAQAVLLEEMSWLAEQQHQGRSLETTELYFRTNGMVPAGNLLQARLDLDAIGHFVSQRAGYYLFGADPAGAGAGHEVAMSTTNGFIFFDPNFGYASFLSLHAMLAFFRVEWRAGYPELMNGTASIFRYV